MTAIVGVLNKHGVAIAADSAVTYKRFDGAKVVNSGKKIFTLSKKYPVGIATYNMLSFLGIPWEIIIKSYREKCHRKNKKPFAKLEDYVNDFMTYLRNYHVNFTKQRQENQLHFVIEQFIMVVHENYKSYNAYNTLSDVDRMVVFLAFVKTQYDVSDKCAEFESYSREQFDRDMRPRIWQRLDIFYNMLSKADLNKIKVAYADAFYSYIISCNSINEHTGLIFFGYGEEELFPSLIPININLYWKQRLRCYIDIPKVAIVDDRQSSSLKSFAQTDVSDSIVSGIDPQVESAVFDTLNRAMHDYADIVADDMEKLGIDKAMVDKIRTTDFSVILDTYKNSFKWFINSSYSQKFINSINYLDKEDMADLAQSIVSLTCQKRHVTEVNETVGGPVDVAIISKADGFIWIKRKHYFDPELNAQFFNLYNDKH